jgi:hypothetical protein
VAVASRPARRGAGGPAALLVGCGGGLPVSRDRLGSQDYGLRRIISSLVSVVAGSSTGPEHRQADASISLSQRQ